MTDRSERELQVAADRALGHDLGDLITHGREAEVSLPEPSAEVTVKTSLKLPPGLHQRVKVAAETRGVGVSTLIREWIELGLTEEENDRQVSLAEIRRAIAHAAQSGDAA